MVQPPSRVERPVHLAGEAHHLARELPLQRLDVARLHLLLLAALLSALVREAALVALASYDKASASRLAKSPWCQTSS